jgi:hypothetical protein
MREPYYYYLVGGGLAAAFVVLQGVGVLRSQAGAQSRRASRKAK